VLVTLFVADLRHHSVARDGRQLDLLVAVDLICGQHSVVLLAMTGEAVTGGKSVTGGSVGGDLNFPRWLLRGRPQGPPNTGQLFRAELPRDARGGPSEPGWQA